MQAGDYGYGIYGFGLYGMYEETPPIEEPETPPVVPTRRAKCPFCHKQPRCVVCGGSGWVRMA